MQKYRFENYFFGSGEGVGVVENLYFITLYKIDFSVDLKVACFLIKHLIANFFSIKRNECVLFDKITGSRCEVSASSG